jgi:hypothetical protein
MCRDDQGEIRKETCPSFAGMWVATIILIPVSI